MREAARFFWRARCLL